MLLNETNKTNGSDANKLKYQFEMCLHRDVDKRKRRQKHDTNSITYNFLNGKRGREKEVERKREREIRIFWLSSNGIAPSPERQQQFQ